VPDPNSGFIGIAAGGYHSLGLKSDGSVVAWGDNSSGQCNVPALSPGSVYTAISAGWIHSLAIEEDGTPPTTSVTSVSPPPTPDGWNNSDATLTLNAADGGDVTGVREIRYFLTGATQRPVTTVAGHSAQIPISAEGSTTVSYWSVDLAGNEEAPKTKTVQIDKTAPDVSIAAAPKVLWPPNDKMVPVSIGGSASDARPGMSALAFKVQDEYGKIEPAIPGFGSVILLKRAGTGRIKTAGSTRSR